MWVVSSFVPSPGHTQAPSTADTRVLKANVPEAVVAGREPAALWAGELGLPGTALSLHQLGMCTPDTEFLASVQPQNQGVVVGRKSPLLISLLVTRESGVPRRIPVTWQQGEPGYVLTEIPTLCFFQTGCLFSSCSLECH